MDKQWIELSTQIGVHTKKFVRIKRNACNLSCIALSSSILDVQTAFQTLHFALTHLYVGILNEWRSNNDMSLNELV